MAKRDLKKGETLDELGGYTTYGLAERSTVQREQRLLPIGVSQGARLVTDIAQDQAITQDDVELPSGGLCDQLRSEQDRLFAS